MTSKKELEKELCFLRRELECPGTRHKPHIFDENNDGDIYEQITSMLTEDELKMINRYFELVIWTNPDIDGSKSYFNMPILNFMCMKILRNLFKNPSYSTTSTYDNNRKIGRKNRFFLTQRVSMKFLQSLDIFKKLDIDVNDKPSSHKFDRKDNRFYV